MHLLSAATGNIVVDIFTIDLGFGRDGRLLTLFSSSDEEEEDELRDLLPLLVVVTKAWLTEWLEETGGG